MSKMVYLIGGYLAFNALAKKYLKDFIKDFFIGKNENIDQDIDQLLNMLITCFVAILACSYYILTQPNKNPV